MRYRLQYAKVLDRDVLLRNGGRVRPGLDSVVYLRAEPPSEAAVFTIVRSWEHTEEFQETWRLVDPEGRTLRESIERTVLPGQGEIADEVAGQEFPIADDAFDVVLAVDGTEAARVSFPVRVGQSPSL